MNIKKLAFLAAVALLILVYVQEQGIQVPGFSSPPESTDDTLLNAFEQKRSDLQVRGEGVVTKILPDDRKGSRHQRFILRLGSGQTILIAHNIDLAPRIDGLKSGDTIAFYGEYEWNPMGGVIHWTHHDPDGNHVDGWLEHQGKRYQ